LTSVITVNRKLLTVNSNDFIIVKFLSGPDDVFDVPLVKKVVAEISEGIKKYPNRLEMRSWKLSALYRIKDWESYTKEAIDAVNESKTNGNNWMWLDNEKLKDGKSFFLDIMDGFLTGSRNSKNQTGIFIN